MTPEEAAEHNITAEHAAQAHQCRECGRWYTGPGAAGWRQGPDGVAYARAGMCSQRCVDADLTTETAPKDHFSCVPVGDGAGHFNPRLFDSETENSLAREARCAVGPTRVARMLLDSLDYLLCDSISQTEAFRRLKLMRAARKACVDADLTSKEK